MSPLPNGHKARRLDPVKPNPPLQHKKNQLPHCYPFYLFSFAGWIFLIEIFSQCRSLEYAGQKKKITEKKHY